MALDLDFDGQATLSIKFDPSDWIARVAPKKKLKKLLTQKLTLKKAALSFLDHPATDFIVKDAVVDVALRAVKSYRARVKDDPSLKQDLLDDPALLVNRVQNEVILQVHEGIKKTYGGQKAIWLPSDAQEPRPEHQLNYGKQYEIGIGIGGVEPGDEYGCRCGVEILTDDTKLDL